MTRQWFRGAEINRLMVDISRPSIPGQWAVGSGQRAAMEGLFLCLPRLSVGLTLGGCQPTVRRVRAGGAHSLAWQMETTLVHDSMLIDHPP
jgi:hypothetical protein